MTAYDPRTHNDRAKTRHLRFLPTRQGVASEVQSPCEVLGGVKCGASGTSSASRRGWKRGGGWIEKRN